MRKVFYYDSFSGKYFISDDVVVRELSFRVSSYMEIIDYRYLFPCLSYHILCVDYMRVCV
jgi:hypothetical protein